MRALFPCRRIPCRQIPNPTTSDGHRVRGFERPTAPQMTCRERRRCDTDSQMNAVLGTYERQHASEILIICRLLRECASETGEEVIETTRGDHPATESRLCTAHARLGWPVPRRMVVLPPSRGRIRWILAPIATLTAETLTADSCRSEGRFWTTPMHFCQTLNCKAVLRCGAQRGGAADSMADPPPELKGSRPPPKSDFWQIHALVGSSDEKKTTPNRPMILRYGQGRL